MPQHMTPLVMVALLVVTAGCSGLFGGGTTSGTPTELPSSSEDNEQIQPSSTPTETTVAEPAFSTDTETDEILLTLTDTPNGYTVTGEVYRTRASAMGSVEKQMKTYDMILNHERSFEYQGDNNRQPDLLFASVSIFESVAAAESYERSFVSDLNITSSEAFEIDGNTTARVIKFVNRDGDKNTLVIATVDNAIFYVVTSDRDSFYPKLSKEMLLSMLSRAQESVRDT